MSLKIDCHTHVGHYRDIQWRSELAQWDEVTLEALMSFLDDLAVNKAVLLPTYSWDIMNRLPTEYVIEACGEHLDRLLPFCVVEVREEGFEERLSSYKDLGCMGIGEHTSKIPIDHALNLELYETCGKLELPILIHLAAAPSDEYGALDNLLLEGLEEALGRHSNVDFIMHGPGWWRCISSDVEDPAVSYPSGRISEPGRAVHLLENYENLNADLSARSGYNALARDMTFARDFLERMSHKLLYGTDLKGFFESKYSHLKLLEKADLSTQAYERIYHENLERLLHLRNDGV